MTKEEFIEIWNLHDEEYHNFKRIENKICESSDLSAFMMIHKFMINKRSDLIISSEHDEIFLPCLDELNLEKIKEEDIIYLIRCGVRYDDDYDCLAMFI